VKALLLSDPTQNTVPFHVAEKRLPTLTVGNVTMDHVIPSGDVAKLVFAVPAVPVPAATKRDPFVASANMPFGIAGGVLAVQTIPSGDVATTLGEFPTAQNCVPDHAKSL
jgi:hypothetical protein